MHEPHFVLKHTMKAFHSSTCRHGHDDLIITVQAKAI